MAGILNRAADAASRAKQWLMEHAYLVTLFAVIAVVAASGMYTRGLQTEREESLQAAAQAPEVVSQEPVVTPLPTLAPMRWPVASVRPKAVAVRPVPGEILRAYSCEPVLWQALCSMQAHEAIDVAGERDEPVLSMMDGVVEETAMDALWGWSVRIAHTDGSEGLYAGLALSFVQAGQSVSRGQEIGLLMEAVPCEAELGPHLHLEMSRDGVRQDPEGMLPE